MSCVFEYDHPSLRACKLAYPKNVKRKAKNLAKDILILIITCDLKPVFIH